MINLIGINYTIGIFLYLIHGVLFNNNSEETEQSKSELDKKLDELENDFFSNMSTSEAPNKLNEIIGQLSENVYILQLIVFIIFQLPLINILIFVSELKDKIKGV